MKEVILIDYETQMKDKNKKKAEYKNKIDSEGSEYIQLLRDELPNNYFIEKKEYREVYGGFCPSTLYKYFDVFVLEQIKEKGILFQKSKELKRIVARIIISLWSEDWTQGYKVRKDGIEIYDKSDTTILKGLKKFAKDQEFKNIELYGTRICPDCKRGRPDNLTLGHSYTECIYCGSYSWGSVKFIS